MAAPRAVQLTELESKVLGLVSDDYESPASISGDIARELGRSVEEAEVSAALRALVHKGLVAAFRYNKEAEAFEHIELNPNMAAEKLWYLALPRGRTEIDQSAI
jgi:hypothetical protein